MIQANELRIGNWFESKGKYFQVNNRNIKYTQDMEAIPLTIEIVEKCGFHYDASYVVPKIQKKNFILFGYEDEFSANFGHMEQLDVSVKYLHQLQNLYYVLIGEELKVNL